MNEYDPQLAGALRPHHPRDREAPERETARANEGTAMTGNNSPLGRESMAFKEKMEKYLAAMEFNLYAAEQACSDAKGYQNCPGCPFYSGCIVGSNKCDKIRALIGDHVIQHDCTEQP